MTIARLRGTTLAYDVAGNALGGVSVPFVWGHGLSSSRASEDLGQLLDFSVLARDRPVVRYDARGHGESGAIESPDQGEWSQLSADQLALADHLGLETFDLGGASMGAATALFTALAAPARIRRLVLMIPPTAWETRAEQVEMYATLASMIERSGVEPIIAASASVAPPDPFVADTATYKAHRAESMRSADPQRLIAAFGAAGVADLPERDLLRTIEIPTLILAWTGDPGHPVSTAEQLADLLPDAELAVASTAADLAEWTPRTLAFLD